VQSQALGELMRIERARRELGKHAEFDRAQQGLRMPETQAQL